MILIVMITTLISAQTRYTEINQLVQSGEFKKATELIDEKLKSDQLSSDEIFELQFEKERLDRIKKDFNKTAEDILKFVNKYYPEAKEKDLAKWENNGSIEFKVIDGKKWYFSRAATNLFKINKDVKQQIEKIAGSQKDIYRIFIEKYLPPI